MISSGVGARPFCRSSHSLNERPLRLTGGASGGVCLKLPIKGILRPATFIPCRIATPNILPGQLADNLKLLFVACLAFCSPPKLHDSIGRRIDDAVDLRGEFFKRTLHFAVIFVLIVNASHATDDVAKAALGNVDAHTGPAHQCSARAPKIVQPPAGYASCRRQPCQWRGQRKRMATIIAKTNAPPSMRGRLFKTSCAALLSGLTRSTATLFRRAGSVRSVFRPVWPCDIRPLRRGVRRSTAGSALARGTVAVPFTSAQSPPISCGFHRRKVYGCLGWPSRHNATCHGQSGY